MKFKKKLFPFFLFLFLAFFFRFYHFEKLQYFSVDEDIFYALLRKMARERKPLLTTPNEATGLTLGSFFHLLSLPFFMISKQNPIFMGIFSSLLGALTAFFVFKAGKTINFKTGFLAAFFYSASFFISLSDRRFWPLTPNSILSVLAFIFLFRIAKNKVYSWKDLFGFTACAIFGWHADLSPLVIFVAGIFTFIFFKIKIFRKEALPAFLLFIFSFMPIAVFELKHNFPNYKAIKTILYRMSQKTETKDNFKKGLNLKIFWQTPFRIINTSYFPTKNLFFYNPDAMPSLRYPLFSALLYFFAFIGMLKKLLGKKISDFLFVYLLFIFYLAFFFGYLLFALGFSGRFSVHYFTLLFPQFCLFLGFGLSSFQNKKIKKFIFLLLAFFLYFNFSALFKARIFPSTSDKIKAITLIKPCLKKDKFAAYDFGFPEGGSHHLYAINEVQPVKSSAYDMWYWLYLSYGLFEIKPEVDWPKKVALMLNQEAQLKEIDKKNLICQKKYLDIYLLVLNNETFWLNNKKIKQIAGY